MEVCVDNITSALNAENGGASRIELCSALSEGGLTPTLGFLRVVKEALDLPVFPMLRCRQGNFVYLDREMEIMLCDLASLKEGGADGIVFGCLDREGNVDNSVCRKVIEVAGKLPVTFHRAFDETSNPMKSLEDIVSLGCTRLLTSGQGKTAQEGIPLLKILCNDDRLTVMPGGGINTNNLREILEMTGAKEFHGSAKASVMQDGKMICITQESAVRQMVQIYNSVHTSKY